MCKRAPRFHIAFLVLALAAEVFWILDQFAVLD